MLCLSMNADPNAALCKFSDLLSSKCELQYAGEVDDDEIDVKSSSEYVLF